MNKYMWHFLKITEVRFTACMVSNSGENIATQHL